MSLSLAVSQAVQTAFLAAGDLVTEFDIQSTESSHEPSTGAVDTSLGDTSKFLGIEVDNDESYMDLSSVPTHDRTLLFMVSDTVVKVGDLVLSLESSEHVVQVQNIKVGQTVVAQIAWCKS